MSDNRSYVDYIHLHARTKPNYPYTQGFLRAGSYFGLRLRAPNQRHLLRAPTSGGRAAGPGDRGPATSSTRNAARRRCCASLACLRFGRGDRCARVLRSPCSRPGSPRHGAGAGTTAWSRRPPGRRSRTRCSTSGPSADSTIMSVDCSWRPAHSLAGSSWLLAEALGGASLRLGGLGLAVSGRRVRLQ